MSIKLDSGKHWIDQIPHNERVEVLRLLDEAILWRGWDNADFHRQQKQIHESHHDFHKSYAEISVQEITKLLLKECGIDMEKYT